MKVIRLRPAARADVRGILDYLERETGSHRIRRRFLVAFEMTCRLLAAHPEIGQREVLASKATEDLRRFPIEHFDKYLIFYTLSPPALHIARVLHGARDRSNLFGGGPPSA